MCCRYYFADLTREDIERLAETVDANVSKERRGDIHPSDMATILTGKKPGLVAEDMRWGFPSSQTGQLLINARSEGALGKKTFSESLLRRRCIIPAQHFYEWDRKKNKVTCKLQTGTSMFMAGFYNRFPDGDHFMILTTEANASMSPVHDRMPLILPEELIHDWIYEEKLVGELLKKASPMLATSREFHQMSLFE